MNLVDFVTEESRRAGKGAAKYIQDKLLNNGQTFKTKPLSGVSYIVPQTVRLENVEKYLDLFLRVRNVYKNVKLIIKGDDDIIKEIKKRNLAPGEMEHLTLPVNSITGKSFEYLTIEVKEEA